MSVERSLGTGPTATEPNPQNLEKSFVDENCQRNYKIGVTIHHGSLRSLLGKSVGYLFLVLGKIWWLQHTHHWLWSLLLFLTDSSIIVRSTGVKVLAYFLLLCPNKRCQSHGLFYNNVCNISWKLINTVKIHKAVRGRVRSCVYFTYTRENPVANVRGRPRT